MVLKVEDLFKVDGAVLILGETGSGKSHLAREIHINSARKKYPFLILNLATIVEDLLESELFGHLKGAFTGAANNKKGYAESVGSGTLFLDEIGELSPRGQKKLLFLLEEKKFIPVGDTVTREFRGRIIAATNKNLSQLVEEGIFRKDLYYRLRVFSYHLLSIKEDREKLNQLIVQFLNSFGEIQGKGILSLTPQCLEILMNYSWPGNIREVKATVEYMASLSDKKQIGIKFLPEWIKIAENPLAIDKGVVAILPQNLPLDYNEALERFEAIYLTYVLKKYHGRVNYTATRIKMSKSTLIAKARKYGIKTNLLRALESGCKGLSAEVIS